MAGNVLMVVIDFVIVPVEDSHTVLTSLLLMKRMLSERKLPMLLAGSQSCSVPTHTRQQNTMDVKCFLCPGSQVGKAASFITWRFWYHRMASIIILQFRNEMISHQPRGSSYLQCIIWYNNYVFNTIFDSRRDIQVCLKPKILYCSSVFAAV